MKLARAAATLLALAVLVACSDDPEPRIEPSESPTSPSTSPTSEPPDALGPEETVRAWVDARNVLMLEGDATPVEALSAPDCSTCRNSIDPVMEVHENGGRFETTGWRIASSRVRSENSKSAVVSIALVIAGGRTFPAEGADPVTYAEEKRMVLVTVSSSGEEWLVSELLYLS